MGLPGRFAFVPRSISGSMIGASAKQPTGTNGFLYYEVIDGMSGVNSLGHVSGTGSGKRIGLIGYDYIGAFWSCVFTAGTNLTPVATAWANDVQEILDFLASLPPPQTIDQAGNYIPFPASVGSTSS